MWLQSTPKRLGLLTWRLAKFYEPYGMLLTSTGTASSIFAYAGEQIDTTGLVYLRARYMNPRLGIFLARDPWSGDQMRPGSMNGFNYVEGNPVNRIDPSGKWWWGAGQTLFEHSFNRYNNQNLHVRIQAIWMLGRPDQVHAEYVIPRDNLPVDLLDSVSGEMWEIKPWADRDDAWWELEPRIYAMIDAQRDGLLRGMTPVATEYDWVNNGPSTWYPGTSFPREVYVGVDETGMYDFWAGTYEAGVIVWWKVNRTQPKYDPRPIYVPWPMKKTDRNERPNWKPGELAPAPSYTNNDSLRKAGELAGLVTFLYGCARVVRFFYEGYRCGVSGVCAFSTD
jgi:RHS repeat-associated protein